MTPMSKQTETAKNSNASSEGVESYEEATRNPYYQEFGRIFIKGARSAFGNDYLLCRLCDQLNSKMDENNSKERRRNLDVPSDYTSLELHAERHKENGEKLEKIEPRNPAYQKLQRMQNKYYSLEDELDSQLANIEIFIRENPKVEKYLSLALQEAIAARKEEISRLGSRLLNVRLD